jgi:hypothetical protein
MNETPRIPVTVIDSINQRQTRKPLHIPTNIESAVVAAAIARLFGHVSVDFNGHPYNYRLRMDNKKLINPNETIAQAKVKINGILYLTYEPIAVGHESVNRNFKPKVFISYSRKDINFAADIYMILNESNECIPWMDLYDLIPGQDWESVIHHNIETADFFIACLSNNSVSTRGYVQKELKEAISILEQMPEGQIYLIPVRIDDCSVPASLAGKHWLDWSTPNAKESLFKAIRSKK